MNSEHTAEMVLPSKTSLPPLAATKLCIPLSVMPCFGKSVLEGTAAAPAAVDRDGGGGEEQEKDIVEGIVDLGLAPG